MQNFKLKQTSEQVQKAIDNALYPDKELTKEGVPADSKAVGIEIKKNSIHIGTEAPTNGETVWIDTDEEPEENGGSGGTSIDVTAEVGQTIVVKEVDANGKPTKWESADYQPRTHWPGETVVIPETTLAVEDNFVGIETDFNYVVGKEYKVTFNGVEYLCTAFDAGAKLGAEDGEVVPAIGNVDMLDGTGDNGIPFASLFDGILVFAVFDGSASVTLSVAEIVYNPIPAQYVTNALPYYIEVTAEMDSNNGGAVSGYSCNETWENLEAIHRSGRNIILRLNTFDEGNNALFLSYYQLSSALSKYSVSPRILFGFVQPSKYANNQPVLILTPQEDGTYTISETLD